MIYVDDIILMTRSTETLKKAKEALNNIFDMKDMGPIRWFLGIRIDRRAEGIYLTQTSYVDKILNRFRMTDAKIKDVPLSPGDDTKKMTFPPEPVDADNTYPYRELVGCLLYLGVCTRPDISYAIASLARFVANPHEVHWNMLKGLLRYVKGTKDYGLFYGKCSQSDKGSQALYAYVDASWADDLMTRRSTTGVLTYIGSHLVDWSSKLQSLVTHSIAEAEYVAADSATRTVIWFRTLLKDLNDEQLEPTIMYEDNMACLLLSKREGKFLTSKHIGLRYHYLREKVMLKEIKMEYVPTDQQLADMLTKALAFRKFDELMKRIVARARNVEESPEPRVGVTN